MQRDSAENSFIETDFIQIWMPTATFNYIHQRLLTGLSQQTLSSLCWFESHTTLDLALKLLPFL